MGEYEEKYEKVDQISWMLQQAHEAGDVEVIDAVYLLLKRIYPD